MTLMAEDQAATLGLKTLVDDAAIAHTVVGTR